MLIPLMSHELWSGRVWTRVFFFPRVSLNVRRELRSKGAVGRGRGLGGGLGGILKRGGRVDDVRRVETIFLRVFLPTGRARASVRTYLLRPDKLNARERNWPV